MKWDPVQYARYSDERGRPFGDLVRRIPTAAPRRVVDLGCGPGNLSASLPAKWPGAAVLGIDSSPDMIATAEALGSEVRFEVADVAGYRPDGVDVIVSNACLQWVPEHRMLIAEWSRSLPPDGSIAFQVPGNSDAPSHALMRELAQAPRWAPRLSGLLRESIVVASPDEYARLLLAAGLEADVWETTYTHVLTGRDPVLEWLRGTGLRPILEALPADEAAQFETEFAALLREAYPAENGTTLLPFRRIFAIGHASPERLLRTTGR